MLTRSIPSTGEVLPAVGLGTWRTFDVGSNPAEREPLREVVRHFVELGGRLIDTSPMYGRAEAIVGFLVDELGLHDDVFLATKVWTEGREAGIEQMKTSMRLLGTERIDLMQVHNLVDVDVHLETLRDWKTTGRIRYIGITHYTNSAHDALAALLERYRGTIDFVQFNYSLAERDAERRLLPLAQDLGVAVLANRPLGTGALIDSVRNRPLPEWATEFDCTSWSQFLLKYILAHPAVTCAIPATSNPAHLEDNMAAGEGRLPDDALRRRMVEYVEGV